MPSLICPTCQLRERDLRRAKLAEQEAKTKAAAEKKDGKDERMEELLRKVRIMFREVTTCKSARVTLQSGTVCITCCKRR